jgi:hypothetical protein
MMKTLFVVASCLLINFVISQNTTNTSVSYTPNTTVTHMTNTTIFASTTATTAPMTTNTTQSPKNSSAANNNLGGSIVIATLCFLAYFFLN